MRDRSSLVSAQLGLLAALGVVLGAFRVGWTAEPARRPDAPAPERTVVLVDLPPTAPSLTPPPPPPSAAPPVETPDAEVTVASIVEDVVPAPLRPPGRVVRDAPPLPPPLPPVRRTEPAEPFVDVPDVMPALDGGLAAFQRTVAYPRLCREVGIEGRVILRFVVGADGAVSDVEVLRGIGGGCDEAAVEAVRRARFTPGLQRGRPVRVRMTLPISFKLQ